MLNEWRFTLLLKQMYEHRGLYCFYGKFPKIVLGYHLICILSLSYSYNKLSNYIVKPTATSPNVIKEQY